MAMKRLGRIGVAAGLVVITASTQASTLLSEGFESFGTLASNGWVLVNASTPPGSTSLAPGDPTIFSAQAGSDGSYVSGNYNNADIGGFISSWLITPQFSTAFAGTVAFWARGDILAGYADKLSFGLSNAASGDFTGGSLGAPITVEGSWTQYTVNFNARGAGTTARFAIVYNGAADTSNFVGIDTLSVDSIPEPSIWAMLGAGLGGVLLARRRNGAAR
jgi:hypothetical protein